MRKDFRGRLVSSPFRQTLIKACFVITCNVTRNSYGTAAQTPAQDTRLKLMCYFCSTQHQISWTNLLFFTLCDSYNKFLVGKITESGGKL